MDKAERILKSIEQTYHYAQAEATRALNQGQDDAAEIQEYADFCYRNYQKAIALINSGETAEAEKLLFAPLD